MPTQKTFNFQSRTIRGTIEEVWTGHKASFYVLTAALPENFWGYTEYFNEEGAIVKTDAFLGKRQFLDSFRDYISGQYTKQEKILKVKE